MKLFKLALKRETAMPVFALMFASAVCFFLVTARVFWTGELHYAFLIWNLFLAWLPLVFALFAAENFRLKSGKSWQFLAAAGGWLLFFPNAPYIFTDVIHLNRGYLHHFWVDLVLILSCALTGLILGFISLFLMQTIVAKMAGRFASWLFIAGVAGLTGVGIFVGRFLRLNSWDVLLKPLALSRGLGHLAANPFAHFGSFALSGLFATFLFITYLMLYALTHLRPSPELAEI